MNKHFLSKILRGWLFVIIGWQLTSCGYLNNLYEANPTVNIYFTIERPLHSEVRKKLVETAKQQGFRIKTYDGYAFEDDFWASFTRRDIVGHASTAGDKDYLILSLNKSKYFSKPMDEDVIRVAEVLTTALEEIDGVARDRIFIREKDH